MSIFRTENDRCLNTGIGTYFQTSTKLNMTPCNNNNNLNENISEIIALDKKQFYIIENKSGNMCMGENQNDNSVKMLSKNGGVRDCLQFQIHEKEPLKFDQINNFEFYLAPLNNSINNNINNNGNITIKGINSSTGNYSNDIYNRIIGRVGGNLESHKALDVRGFLEDDHYSSLFHDSFKIHCIIMCGNYQLIPDVEKKRLYYKQGGVDYSKRLIINSSIDNNNLYDTNDIRDGKPKTPNIVKIGVMVNNQEKYVKLDTTINSYDKTFRIEDSSASASHFKIMPFKVNNKDINEFTQFAYNNQDPVIDDDNSVTNISTFINQDMFLYHNTSDNYIYTLNPSNNMSGNSRTTSSNYANTQLSETDNYKFRIRPVTTVNTTNELSNLSNMLNSTNIFNSREPYDNYSSHLSFESNEELFGWFLDYIYKVENVSDIPTNIENIDILQNYLRNNNSTNSYYHNFLTSDYFLPSLKSIYSKLVSHNNFAKDINDKMEKVEKNPLFSGYNFFISPYPLSTISTYTSISYPLDEYSYFIAEIMDSETISYLNSDEVKESNTPNIVLDEIKSDVVFLKFLDRLYVHFSNNFTNISYCNVLYDYLNIFRIDGPKIVMNNTGNVNMIIGNNSQNVDLEEIYDRYLAIDLNDISDSNLDYSENNKKIVDVDFTNFYLELYENSPPPIENYLFEDPSNNTRIEYYKQLVRTQKYYFTRFEKMKFLNDCLFNNVIGIFPVESSNYDEIINKIYDKIFSDYKNKFEETFVENSFNANNMKFIEILEKYYNLYSLTDNNDVDRKATIFCFCYAQISFNIEENYDYDYNLIKDQFNIEDFNNNNLRMRDYYDNPEYILTKHNIDLRVHFVDTYESTFTKALQESGLLMEADSIFSLNDPRLLEYINTIAQDTNELTNQQTNIQSYFSPQEGFGGREAFTTETISTSFPNTPSYLNTNHIYKNNDSLKLIQDAYVYKNDNDEYNKYQPFDTFINNTISNAEIDFTKQTSFKCGDYDPKIKVNFKCGEQGIHEYNDVYKSNIFTEICNEQNDHCNISDKIIIKLENKKNGNGLKILLIRESDEKKCKIGNIDIFSLNISNLENFLEKFPNQGEIKELSMDNTNGTINMLHKMSYDDNIDTLTGNKCLMEPNNYVKLYITKEGNLKFRYVKKIYRDINDGLFTGTVSTIDDTENPPYLYTSLYDINNAKYKELGNNIENVKGYVGYDGVYHKDSQNTMLSNDYKTYNNYCFAKKDENGTINKDNKIKSVLNDGNISCSQDSSCIGTIQLPSVGNNYIDYNGNVPIIDLYKVTNENKKYLYPCKNGSDYNHKQLSLNTNNNACIRNAKNSQLIDNETYHSLNIGKEFDPSQCGFNELLLPNKEDFENKRNIFQNDFNNLVNSFNELNENELKILKETNIKVDELNTLLNEYKSIVNRVNIRNDAIVLSKQQAKDSKQLSQKMQYKSAIIGLSSMALAIGCFHLMKK